MKLLVQSDDYAITKAVSYGCIEGIKNGIIRNTGVFVNMPWSEECVEWIRPYLDEIAFGIDLNASTGFSILSYEKIPSLIHEDGSFLGSKENRALDTQENNFDHLSVHKDELYSEFKAQIERYIELVGHKPDYIHNHAYGSKTTDEVTLALAREYKILSTKTIMNRPEVKFAGMGWYVKGGPEAQLSEDPISYILQDKGNILNQDFGYLISHCGYADADLFKLTSFNTNRVKDLECMLSPEVKRWIKDNHIILISINDLPEEWIDEQ